VSVEAPGQRLRVRRSPLAGRVPIPGSKSHTIRAVALASLAAGESRIVAPLRSADTLAAIEAYRALGAEIRSEGETDELGRVVWRVRGLGGEVAAPDRVIDVGNSGTTLRLAAGSAALLPEGQAAVFTGDAQIRRRPAAPLLRALTELGADCFATRGDPPGAAPLVVRGRLAGGRATIDAVTSQYLSSLLLAAPLAARDSEIVVTRLNEAPYVGITLDWLRRCGVSVDAADDWMHFTVRGGQQFQPFDRRVPADFSSATFFLAAGAMTPGGLEVGGLDLDDVQGDKAVIDVLGDMGASVEPGDGVVRVHGEAASLRAIEVDLNAMPDALPMLAALASRIAGETRLVNVPQARLKETDRIDVMARELAKLGADVEQLPDGLIVRGGATRGAEVEGHHDHRVVMALATLGCFLDGETVVSTAEAAAVTYPSFVEHLRRLGGDVDLEPADVELAAAR